MTRYLLHCIKALASDGLNILLYRLLDDSCSRTIYVSLKTEGGSIIYHFQNEGTFKRFSPTFYRVIHYEYDGDSFPGYSEKYFCAPKPFDGPRRFICLNRYRGRFRVRQGTADDFRYLYEGSEFKIEIQAEATVGGVFMYDRCIFNLRLYLPSTTQVSLSIQSSTVTSMSSSLPPMTVSITPSSSGISLATKSSLSATSSYIRSSQIATLTPTPVITVSTTPSEPVYNGMFLRYLFRPCSTVLNISTDYAQVLLSDLEVYGVLMFDRFLIFYKNGFFRGEIISLLIINSG